MIFIFIKRKLITNINKQYHSFINGIKNSISGKYKNNNHPIKKKTTNGCVKKCKQAYAFSNTSILSGTHPHPIPRAGVNSPGVGHNFLSESPRKTIFSKNPEPRADFILKIRFFCINFYRKEMKI